MNEQDFVRRAAAELASEFGPELVPKTELALRGELPPVEATRGFLTPDTLKVIADASVIAHFLIAAAPLVASKLSSISDPAAIRRAVMQSVRRPAGLKVETAERIVDTLVDKASQE